MKKTYFADVGLQYSVSSSNRQWNDLNGECSHLTFLQSGGLELAEPQINFWFVMLPPGRGYSSTGSCNRAEGLPII